MGYQEITNILTNNKIIKTIGEIEKDIPIAKVPIMLKSKICTTNFKKNKKNSECKFDPGGYFLVGRQEKVIISSEKMVDNKTLIFTKKDPTFEEGIVYTAQINSRKFDWNDN